MNVSTATVITAQSAVTSPPVAAPMAKARCSRRYSVRRRSRSQGGREARRAAQLLQGAAASRRAASSPPSQANVASPCTHTTPPRVASHHAHARRR